MIEASHIGGQTMNRNNGREIGQRLIRLRDYISKQKPLPASAKQGEVLLVYRIAQPLRTLSMWRVRSSILQL